MKSWRELMEERFSKTGDSWQDIQHICWRKDDHSALRATLDWKFDSGFGSPEGQPFVAWSQDWIYFCAVYDGAEWVAEVPRNPGGEHEPEHIGGW